MVAYYISNFQHFVIYDGTISVIVFPKDMLIKDKPENVMIISIKNVTQSTFKQM